MGFIIPGETESENLKEVRSEQASQEEERVDDSEADEKTEWNNEKTRR